MKTLEFISLSLVTTLLFCTGCAGPQQTPKPPPEIISIHRQYNGQAYDQCLAEIEKVLKTKMTAGQRASLLLTKGRCQEEMGQDLAAKATYLLIKTEFARSLYAEAAQARLEGRAADQKEHFELTLDDPRWHRSIKEVNEKGVRCFYFLTGENKEHFSVRLMIMSVDLPENIKTLEDVLARAEADFALRGGKVTRHLLEQGENERYFESEEFDPTAKGPQACLTRIHLANGRLHTADFTFQKAAMTADDKTRYLAELKKTKLVSSTLK